MSLTAENKYKWLVLDTLKTDEKLASIFEGIDLHNTTNEEVQSLWESVKSEVDYLLDEADVWCVRCDGEKTGLYRGYSRHYECDEVAAETPYGWVGWTYWYGGGKYGEPQYLDINPYDIKVVSEKEVVTVVREFEEVNNAS
jgi:hypothetical protein